MNINTFAVGFVALALGLGGGYLISQSQAPSPMEHTMGTTMADMTSNLEGKSGAAFEQAFIDEMIVHHVGAVSMAEMVLEKSTRPELVQLANEIIAAQTREINMMRGWKAEWFATTTSTGGAHTTH